MKVQHLRYAIEVARSGSITQTAARLHMAQPNLSSALKELEGEIGIHIFHRTAKGVEVTAEGAEFLSLAAPIIGDMQRLEKRYKNQREATTTVRFASVRSSYASRLLCEFINGLPTAAPLQLYLKETTNYGVLENVATGGADVGRMHFDTSQQEHFSSSAQSKGLVMEQLWRVGSYLLMSKQHPLAAGGGPVRVEQLKPYTEVLHVDFDSSQFSCQALKQRQGLPYPARAVHVNDRATMLDVLSRCPHTYIWAMSTNPDLLDIYGLVAVPCENAGFETIEAVIYPKGKPRSKEVDWIIEGLKGMQYAESFLI